MNDQNTNVNNIAIPLPTSVPQPPRSLWNKTIPITNLVFFLISAALIFILDLSILINSPDLAGFWYMMLFVFGIFVIFFVLENFTFRKKFANSTQPVDAGIVTLIVIRNIIFVLNFIPFIQLLGLAAIVFIGWIILIIYIVLIIRRYKVTG